MNVRVAEPEAIRTPDRLGTYALVFACPPAYFASHKRWGAFVVNGVLFFLFLLFFTGGALRAAFLWWLLSVADARKIGSSSLSCPR